MIRNWFRNWLLDDTEDNSLINRARINQLEKRCQRLEAWVILLGQVTAHQAQGSQKLIKDDHLRYDDKATDEALGNL